VNVALAGALALSVAFVAAGGAPVAVLEHPVRASEQTAVGFGERSHWLQPWRGYTDTVPAARLLDAVGINFDVPPRQAAATARLLAHAGFRRARVEVGWSSFSYTDSQRLREPTSLRTILLALKAQHIRPLILLNANDGQPCPARTLDVRTTTPAPAGATTITVDAATRAAIVPGRSGLTLPPDRKAAGILFTSVDQSGVVALSRPLPDALPSGAHPGTTLLYAPFSRPKLADGKSNPAFERTLQGWLTYASSVAANVRRILGSTRFDLEIWNELSFGSDFLDVNDYYATPVDHGTGDTIAAILRRTVERLRRSNARLGSVGIGDGFASQRPWDSGATVPVGVTAIDKHPYPPAPQRFPANAVFNGIKPLNALGRVDGAADTGGAWHDAFVPSYTAFLPEYALTAIQTETLVRDLSPLTTTIYGVPHGRETHRRGAQPPQVWVTEWNIDSAQALGSAPASVQRHLQAKSALRGLVAFVGAGVRAFYYYSARDPHLGLIDARSSTGGETIAALRRLVASLRGARPLARTQPLELQSISDFSDAKQFDGDGTGAHPPLYDRDVLAFFPFELRRGHYVAATYVMTRNVAQRYGSDPSLATSYDLSPLRFRLAIGGLDGCPVRASLFDPLHGSSAPVRTVSCTRRRVVVELGLTDSPRLLRLTRDSS
jgi:hypothetical protein